MRKKLVNKTSIKNIFIRKSTWILVAIFIVGIITIPSFISKAGSESRSVDYADEIRVLEIEPGNKFLFTAGKQEVNGQDVNVTQMTMPEFISTVDQLTGKYDAVVIARENSGLASKFNIADKETKYFDYSAPFENHLDKAKYLKQLTDDGKDLINFEEWMELPYEYGGETDKGRVFDEYYSENDITDRRAKDVISMIENNQLVYIDEDITNSDSLKNTKLVKNFRNKTSNNILPRSKITLSKIVADYNSNNSKRAYISKLEASDDDSKIDGSKEEHKGSDGKVYGSYDSRNMEFTITVPGGADAYKANLYFDINADGIYTENEMEDTFDLSKYNMGNDRYTITATMDVTFVGYLDWKIELVNKESGKVSSYVTYHTVFKAVEGHRRGIKVLQIHPTGGDDDNALYLCPPGKDTTDSQNKFKNILALEEVANSGYDLDIHSMSATKFNEKTDTDHNYLDTEKYDMIIVGFGDNYANNQLKENACNAIQKFIKDGKSCMFTHDTLTLSTFGGINDNWNGFNEDTLVHRIGLVDHTGPKGGTGPKRFGQMFRDIAGQARYVDPYRNSGKNSNASDLEEKDLDGSIIPHDKLPSSVDKNKDNKTYSLGTTFYMNDYKSTLTTKVRNVNGAQITSYPFNLSNSDNGGTNPSPNEISVAQTHTQWFQLNLEDEDVVPWFNLSGRSNINSGDSRNFYYTYSKGNITYSGTGHSNGYPESEMKLFVNTIIKADRGANFAPNVINYVLELDNKVAVTNNSGAKAKELRISPAGKEKWGKENLLKSELDNGKAVEVHFKGDATINYWDIKLTDVDGNETVWSNVSSDRIFKSESIDLLVKEDNYVLELDNKVAVTNNSGAKAKELRISPAGKGKWSDDNYLKSELDNGKAVEVHFKGDATINYWDIKLTDIDGKETVWSNVSSDKIFKSESIGLLAEINYVLQLDNNSGAKAKELKISPAGKEKWGENLLKAKLDNGEAVEVHFKGDAKINYWDIKLTDVDGKETVLSNVSSDKIFKSESIDLLVKIDNTKTKIRCVSKEVLSKVSYEAGSEIFKDSFVQSENGDFKVDGSEDFYFVSKVKDLNQDDIKVSMTAVVKEVVKGKEVENGQKVELTPIRTDKSKDANKSQFKNTKNVYAAGSYVGGIIDKAYIQEVANQLKDGEEKFIEVTVIAEDYLGAKTSNSFKIKVKPNYSPEVTNFEDGKKIENEAEVSREKDFIFDSLITDKDKDDLEEVVITLDGKEIRREENVATGDEGCRITGTTIAKEILSTKAPGETFEVVVIAKDVRGKMGTKGFTLKLEQEKIEVKHYFVESRKEDGTIDKATITEHRTSINMESKIEAVGYVSKIYEYKKTVKLKIDDGLRITPGTEVKLYVEANNKSVVMNKINDKEEYVCTLTKDLLGDIDMLKGAKIRVEYSVDILQMPDLDQASSYSNRLSVDDESATITIIDEIDDKKYPYLF